jgi:hypothetical protein
MQPRDRVSPDLFSAYRKKELYLAVAPHFNGRHLRRASASEFADCRHIISFRWATAVYLSRESCKEAALANASPLRSHSLIFFQRLLVTTLVLTLSLAGYPAEAFAQDATAPQVDTSPAGLDHLLAPIALYPDALLMQVLAASVNSQEVLDAGNWLLENKSLQGTQIDDAAKKLGFGAATIALLHFPEVVDMMCTQLDWTQQLGVAFGENQAGVLDAVQRLRAQAVQYGNLKSSEQQTVQTQTDNGKQVVVIQPSNPQVVYVPQYNPQTVYVQSGPSTGDVVAASIISFGLGVAVGAMFSSNNYYYPRWGYGGVYYGGRPWVPAHYVYRPVYGPHWRPPAYYRPPANYPYHRPAHYNNNYWKNSNYRGGNNNYRGGHNTVNINTGNNKNNRPGSNNGYNKPSNGNNNSRPSNGYNKPANGNNSSRPSNGYNKPANGNNSTRPANGNNNGYNKPGNGNNNAGNNRPGGTGGYNKPPSGNNNNGGNRPPVNTGGNNSRPGSGGNSRPPTNNTNRPAPDRGYAKPAGGQAQPRPTQARPAQPQTRPAQQARPTQAQARPAPQARPAQARPAPAPTRQAPAFSGGQSGRSANAASQRGAASAGGRKK